MVKLLMGLKGSGKTKKLVGLVCDAVKEGDGDVWRVFRGGAQMDGDRLGNHGEILVHGFSFPFNYKGASGSGTMTAG